MRKTTPGNTQGDYSHYTVEEKAPLLEWLLKKPEKLLLMQE